MLGNFSRMPGAPGFCKCAEIEGVKCPRSLQASTPQSFLFGDMLLHIGKNSAHHVPDFRVDLGAANPCPRLTKAIQAYGLLNRPFCTIRLRKLTSFGKWRARRESNPRPTA